jgi:hypothetical protein
MNKVSNMDIGVVSPKLSTSQTAAHMGQSFNGATEGETSTIGKK